MDWIKRRVGRRASALGINLTSSIVERPDSAGTILKERERLVSMPQCWGPPDLVHIVKERSASAVVAAGSQTSMVSYHHVIGVDVSSTAGIAAYVNSLVNEMPTGWKIRQVTYCCWSVVGQQDVRVEVQLPGSLRTLSELDESDWHGLWLSGAMRYLLYAGRGIGGLREMHLDLDFETLKAAVKSLPDWEYVLREPMAFDLRKRLKILIEAHAEQPRSFTAKQLLGLMVTLKQDALVELMASELIAMDCYQLRNWCDAASALWRAGLTEQASCGNLTSRR